MYAACRQMGLEIVPIDIGARVMAWVGLQGGDERVSLSPRLKCELEHLQELYHIKGGEVPDKDFVLLIQEYTKILWFYKEVKGARFYISDFELKKFEEVGRR